MDAKYFQIKQIHCFETYTLYMKLRMEICLSQTQHNYRNAPTALITHHPKTPTVVFIIDFGL